MDEDNFGSWPHWSRHVVETIKRLEESREKDKKEILVQIGSIKDSLSEFKIEYTKDIASRDEYIKGQMAKRDKEISENISKLKIKVALITAVVAAAVLKIADYIILKM